MLRAPNKAKKFLAVTLKKNPLTIFGLCRLCYVWWQAGFAPGWFPGVGWEVQILPLPGLSSSSSPGVGGEDRSHHHHHQGLDAPTPRIVMGLVMIIRTGKMKDKVGMLVTILRLSKEILVLVLPV